MEKEQALSDLNSVERSLSDLFRRYENLKGVLEGFKKVLYPLREEFFTLVSSWTSLPFHLFAVGQGLPDYIPGGGGVCANDLSMVWIQCHAESFSHVNGSYLHHRVQLIFACFSLLGSLAVTGFVPRFPDQPAQKLEGSVVPRSPWGWGWNSRRHLCTQTGTQWSPLCTK